MITTASRGSRLLTPYPPKIGSTFTRHRSRFTRAISLSNCLSELLLSNTFWLTSLPHTFYLPQEGRPESSLSPGLQPSLVRISLWSICRSWLNRRCRILSRNQTVSQKKTYFLCSSGNETQDWLDYRSKSFIYFRCATHTFQCKYGACVDGEAPCNGVKDCADNSDENLRRCYNETGKFRWAKG